MMRDDMLVGHDAQGSESSSTIEEPPTLAAGYPKARLGPRIHAETIDGLVAVIPIITIAYLLGVLPSAPALSLIRPILMGGCLVWTWYYVFAKDGRAGGQSIGKRRAGLMVVNVATNAPCSRGQSCIRTLVLLLSKIIIPFGLLIECLAVLMSKDGRRFGDRIARTQVIAVSDYTGSVTPSS